MFTRICLLGYGYWDMVWDMVTGIWLLGCVYWDVFAEICLLDMFTGICLLRWFYWDVFTGTRLLGYVSFIANKHWFRLIIVHFRSELLSVIHPPGEETCILVVNLTLVNRSPDKLSY